MKSTIDYSKSAAPNFDAVEDVKDWFGAKYDKLAQEMSKIKNIRRFEILCNFGGVAGFPVKAWYDHFNGQGAWDKAEREMSK